MTISIKKKKKNQQKGDGIPIFIIVEFWYWKIITHGTVIFCNKKW
jgi:hypothetical protein